MPRPVRGTQSFVEQMGWVWTRPLLVAQEIAWRWLFGAPLLVIAVAQAHRILAALPAESTGLDALDAQNPWIMAQQLMRAWLLYRPHVVGVAVWLTPAAALGWIALSSLGRAAVLKRMEPGLRFRPLALAPLQAATALLALGVFYAWFRTMGGLADACITLDAEPNLVGYFMGLIFYSLGFFTLGALASWPLLLAPIVCIEERCSPWAALRICIRPGRALASKLVEVNLVMGIVTLALVVLAMVLSAAPLPFSDELGAEAMHDVYACAAVFYLVASDYFQVVRLRAFVGFWRALGTPINGADREP